MAEYRVVSHAEWIEARKQLLLEEKEFTRRRDALTKKRQALPWESVDKPYLFEAPDGPETFADLFENRSQLVIYHAMFDPASASPSSSWTSNAACEQCSFWADNFNGVVAHLKARDVTLIAVSRAPQAKLKAYSKRMGWSFKWVSSGGNSFNFDYKVSFTPEQIAAGEAEYNYDTLEPGQCEREGVSVFYKDKDDKTFHTYSAYARGIDMLNVAYHYLDLVPKGRDEGHRGPNWVCRHDEYEAQHGKQ